VISGCSSKPLAFYAARSWIEASCIARDRVTAGPRLEVRCGRAYTIAWIDHYLSDSSRSLSTAWDYWRQAIDQTKSRRIEGLRGSKEKC
jgi:hypothetical protein